MPQTGQHSFTSDAVSTTVGSQPPPSPRGHTPVHQGLSVVDRVESYLTCHIAALLSKIWSLYVISCDGRKNWGCEASPAWGGVHG